MARTSQVFRFLFTGTQDSTSPHYLEWGELTWDSSSGRILNAAPLLEFPYESDALLSASHTAITPSFVNAHTHLDLWCEAPIEIHEGESMVTWLQRVNASRDQDSDADVQNRVRASIQAMQRTGTAVVSDITQQPETFLRLVESRMQGILSLEYFHPAPWEEESSPLRMLPFYERWKRFQRYYQESGESNTLLTGISPHSPYNVTLGAWKAIHQALKPAVIHSHLAEFQAELDYFTGKDRTGIDDLHLSTVNQTFVPTDAFSDYLNAEHWQPQDTYPTPLAILAHGSLLTPKQVQAFYKKHSHSVLVSCPRSNLFLHGCTLYTDVPFEADMPVVLGTDSAMSCPTLDIRDELHAYQSHHGIELTPFEGLSLLTEQPAKAFGMGADLGTLELGKLAHASIWDFESPTTPTAKNVLDAILNPHSTPFVKQLILKGDFSFV